MKIIHSDSSDVIFKHVAVAFEEFSSLFTFSVHFNKHATTNSLFMSTAFYSFTINVMFL
jgi:hypothetical protein